LINVLNITNDLKPEEILLYLRKSRADDPALSTEEVLEKHETILDEWCEKNLEGRIPPENRFKEVVSGESIADRPAFQKVLQLIEQPKYKAVMVVEISRLGRPDTMEIGRITKTFRFTQTIVITPMRIFDITDEYERDMFEQELKRGNFYLEYTKKILGRGREMSVRSGNYVSSRPLYGYDKITIMDGKRKCPTLAINEEQANIVRMIFNAYVHENIGTQVISNRLNELNVKAPRGDKWTPDSIRTILENVHYLGMVRWNERKAVTVVRNGEFRKTRPLNNSDDFILCEGKHDAIISEELFNEAQAKRGRTHRACANKELKNPFATLLYCKCGKAMSHRLRKYPNGEDRGEPRLVCNAQARCGNGSCTVSEVVDFVADVLKEKIAEFEVEANSGNEDIVKIHDKLIADLERKLAEIEATEEEMYDNQYSPDLSKRIPNHIFQRLIVKKATEREETKQALETALKNRPTPVDYEKKRITFQRALDALLDDDVSVADKNQLLKTCINRIEYQRGKPEKLKGKGVGRQWSEQPIEIDIKLLT
jgi:DNA invertase Pin-like site-specific DNA recombinase